VRFAFSEDSLGASRPLVDVSIEEFEQPLRCLIDTGSLRTRLPGWIAGVVGLDLEDAPSERISVGGRRTTARQSHVSLAIAGVVLPSSVWFCEPWDAPFGLIGQEDVLRAFRLVYSAHQEWFELTLETSV
jgi:hypothetical protein